MMVGYASPEAAAGGALALVHDGDRITIDAEAGTATLHVGDDELARRRAAWQPPRRDPPTGVLEKYARLVGSAFGGAVTHGAK
jgi:dihydroxy-acid dehydratase